MKKKKRLAFFPVFADTMPVIRYYKKYRSDVEVVELISPPGSSACGKDAGFLDNREQFGIVVITPEDANPNSWDELYILEHNVLGMEDQVIQNRLYDPIISYAHLHGKDVRTTSKAKKESLYSDIRSIKSKKFGMLYPVKKYVVFVGGAIEEANSFEVFLSLFGELSKHLRVVAISSSQNADICDVVSLYGLLYEQSLSETEKVFAINNVILKATREFCPDILLIHVEESLMSFNSSMTNGFGIIPYMVSQVITPDFSVCCLPCDYADSMFIHEFAQDIEGRFCFSPDLWHVSNVLLDGTVAWDTQDSNAIYAPMSSIKTIISKSQGENLLIGNLIDEEFLVKCITEIVRDWRTNELVDFLN